MMQPYVTYLILSLGSWSFSTKNVVPVMSTRPTFPWDNLPILLAKECLHIFLYLSVYSIDDSLIPFLCPHQ